AEARTAVQPAEGGSAMSTLLAIEHWQLAPETACAVDLARAVTGLADSVVASLGRGLDTSDFDHVDIAKAKSREAIQSTELRKLMRGFDVAIAKLNEAKAALRKTEAQPVIEVKLEGVKTARTWQETVAWRKDLAQKMADAHRKNSSRASKIDLLKG